MADSGAKKASEEFFQHLISSSESCVDDKVCVVGIFGKDNIGYKSKAVHLNGTIGKEVFKIDFLDGTFKKKDTDEFSCDINVYHDVEQRIIYLHLVSVYDVSRLLQLCKQAPQDAQNAASHQYWMSHEFYYACALLFLFSVSHIVVLLHPSQTFDLNYIRLFRILASTRHQLLPQISQLLSGVDGIPDIWRQTGRPCIPRLVCSMKQRVPFMDPSQVSGKSQDTYASKTKGKQQSITPQKKLQHAVEDQLYSIMRKARLLGSLSSSSLFTVNSSHAFVHMQPCSTNFDPVAVLLNTLAKPAINTKWVEKSPLLKNSKFLKREFSESGGNSEAHSTDYVLFRDYLKQQIDLLMTGDGGRDGVAEGRRGTHVEVPSCRLWARVSLALYEFFLTPKNDLIAPLTAMASNLDLDMKFSEA
ncbi:protein smg8-like [Pocillopora damicornis]|nr:protein smg8-like [Pocillopora damicornis]